MLSVKSLFSYTVASSDPICNAINASHREIKATEDSAAFPNESTTLTSGPPRVIV
jgi:hypothetical protein